MQLKRDNDQTTNDSPAATETDRLKLTKRETDVIILLCREHSTKQIADVLNISPHTVESHKKALRVKTNSFTVVGIALYAAKNNIFFKALAFILPCFFENDCCEGFVEFLTV